MTILKFEVIVSEMNLIVVSEKIIIIKPVKNVSTLSLLSLIFS